MDVDTESSPLANPGSSLLQMSGDVSSAAAADASKIQCDSTKPDGPQSLTHISGSKRRWLEAASRDRTCKEPFRFNTSHTAGSHKALALLPFQLPARYCRCNWTFSPWLSDIVLTCPISLEKFFRRLETQCGYFTIHGTKHVLDMIKLNE